MDLPPFLTRWPYDEIVLTGHRIRLYTIVRLANDGMTAAEIADVIDLLQSLVEKVLEFCHSNRDEVDDYCAAYRQTTEAQEAMYHGAQVRRITA